MIAGATVLLLFFTATGTWEMRLFGFTLDDLRIGGGLLLFLSTRLVQRVLGDSGANLVTRVMGILIATIAVSYIRDGILSSLGAFRQP